MKELHFQMIILLAERSMITHFSMINKCHNAAYLFEQSGKHLNLPTIISQWEHLGKGILIMVQ